MRNIQDSGLPLCCKIAESNKQVDAHENEIKLQVDAWALEGMQKEAVVSTNFSHGWRMVCDEGPYLNGTDLAPFPLAFFTAGTQFSFLSEVLRHANTLDVELDNVRLKQDNYYTMEGSALRGTMIGGAKPAELTLEISSSADVAKVKKIVQKAILTCPAQALMNTKLANTFAINFNGNDIPVSKVRASDIPVGTHPKQRINSLQPADDNTYLPEIIRKLSTANVVNGVAGGAGSSLQATQKRTLHIHGEASVMDGTLLETTIQLLSPIGSNFYFISDCCDGDDERAPPPLAYISAGVAFCYLTQIGRYAHITKQQLDSYAIRQANGYFVTSESYNELSATTALPADTQVFLAMDGSSEVAQQIVNMGERTCFLHAAMRTYCPSVVKALINGEEFDVSRQ